MHQNITLSTIPAAPYRFVAVSGNKKTGPIPVTSTAAHSCPVACPMRTDSAGGCYASSGNSAIHWRSLTQGKAATALDLEGFTARIRTIAKGQLWRANEAGDLMPDSNDTSRIDAETLRAIVAANHGRKGFTYTHHELTPHNLDLIQYANTNGFTVNISTNNASHADASAALAPGLPLVTLVNAEQWTRRGDNYHAQTPRGRMIVRCPAETMPGITCASCQLCQVSTRKAIVGFTPHGISKARVISIIKG